MQICSPMLENTYRLKAPVAPQLGNSPPSTAAFRKLQSIAYQALVQAKITDDTVNDQIGDDAARGNHFYEI